MEWKYIQYFWKNRQTTIFDNKLFPPDLRGKIELCWEETSRPEVGNSNHWVFKWTEFLKNIGRKNVKAEYNKNRKIKEN